MIKLLKLLNLSDGNMYFNIKGLLCVSLLLEKDNSNVFIISKQQINRSDKFCIFLHNYASRPQASIHQSVNLSWRTTNTVRTISVVLSWNRFTSYGKTGYLTNMTDNVSAPEVRSYTRQKQSNTLPLLALCLWSSS